MRVIIIDDDTDTLLVLKVMLKKIDGVYLAGAFSDYQSAFSFLQDNPVDLVISDIELAQDNGIHLAQEILKLKPRLNFIFISAHSQYALDAFGLYAADYIVKPVSKERLTQTIRRIEGIAQKPLLPTGGLSVYCLGGFDVYTTSGQPINWISSKSEEVFAYLLLHNRRTVSRDRLQEDIFGDSSKNAAIYLNTAIYQLRKVLKVGGCNDLVVSNGDGYRLGEGITFFDLEEFQRLLREAEHGSFSQQILEDVEELYKNNLFEGKGYLWAYPEGERMKGAYIGYLLKLSSSFLATGRKREGIRLLEKILCLDDLDAVALKKLMQALAEEGNTARLEGIYNSYSSKLFKEYGECPDYSLREFYQTLKTGII